MITIGRTSSLKVLLYRVRIDNALTQQAAVMALQPPAEDLRFFKS